MSARQGWYVAGLVAAVAALVLSVAAVAVVVAGSGPGWRAASETPAETWRRGPVDDGMMGRGGGMGRDWDEGSTVTVEQATATARAWVDAHEPGATLGTPVVMPRGYLFTVTTQDRVIGTIMVNEVTGRLVWRESAQPSPAASSPPGA